MNLRRVKVYYWLAKPNMAYGNLVTTLGGFLLASRGDINWGLLFATLCGTGLIIGSGCVFNNYFDREIDSKMERTKNRAMVKGLVSDTNAIIYGSILGLIGLFILARFTNLWTACIGVVGFMVYVFWYTPSKHTSINSTLIGTIAGATPILAGYIAFTNNFDGPALLLFLILVFWQMVHFYSIGIYRRDEYKSAGLPILPVTKGYNTARKQILYYLIGFIVVTEALGILGYTGKIYLGVMTLLSLNWLRIYRKGFAKSVDEKRWAKKMFLYSLSVLMIFSLIIAFDYVR